MKFYSKKLIHLATADCHLHYANNRERGRDNVTITFVEINTPRPAYTRAYDNMPNAVIRQYRVSGWAGNVNIPTADINYFGGIKK